MVSQVDPIEEALDTSRHEVVFEDFSLELPVSNSESEHELTGWALVRSFKGINDADMEAGHGALMLGFRVYFILAMLLIGYRNIVFDPTLAGVLVTLNTFVAILITMAHLVETPNFRVNRRHQILVIALMMMISAAVIQYRNPAWPAISFVTALPTSVLLLVLVGSWPAFIIHLLYCITWSIIVLAAGSLKLIPMIAVAIGVYPLPLMLMGFLAVALQTRERNSTQLKLAQHRLGMRVNARNALISQVKEEMTIPLEAIRALPLMTKVSSQALFDQANDLSKEVSAQLQALRGSLEIDKSDLSITHAPSNVFAFMEALRRRVQPRLAAKGLVFEIDPRQLLADTYEFDAQKLQFALLALVESETACPEATYMSLAASCQQKTDDFHSLHLTLTFDGVLLDDTARHYFPGGHCPPPTSNELAAINNDITPFPLVATLLQRMGGSFHYRPSEHGQESSYHLILPVKTCAEAPDEGPLVQNEHCFEGLRVAIIDQDLLVARLLYSILAAGGCESVELAPMRDALRIQKLSGRPIDVVFFDSSNLLIPIDRFIQMTGEGAQHIPYVAMHPTGSQGTRPTSNKIAAIIPRPPTFDAVKTALKDIGLTGRKNPD